jgi:hypothetical protein
VFEIKITFIDPVLRPLKKKFEKPVKANQCKNNLLVAKISNRSHIRLAGPAVCLLTLVIGNSWHNVYPVRQMTVDLSWQRSYIKQRTADYTVLPTEWL